MWMMTCSRRNANSWATGGADKFQITANHVNFVNDVFTFTEPEPSTGSDVNKASISRIGVFPNPCYVGSSDNGPSFRNRVTFNNLPANVVVRIFNLAGHLVRTLHKQDVTQFLDWDLTNEDYWQVASGIYLCVIEMPDLGQTKVLKLAVIQGQTYPSIR